MNNLNYQATWAKFQPYRLSKDNPCSGNCEVKIVKTLPLWISHQPFWTYYCECCSTYQLERGKSTPGAIYD